MDRPLKTHRCKELLKHNKNTYRPCAIQYDTWLNFSPYDNKYKWILKAMEFNEEDWDVKWMDNITEIKYCPFCSKELK